MFCRQCGKELKEGALFCSNCGMQQEVLEQPEKMNVEEEKTIGFFDSIPNMPVEQNMNDLNQTYSNASNQGTSSKASVSFGEAVKLYFKNYTNFTGRASKSEFWWGFLFAFLICMIPGGAFVAMIPSLSLAIRRFHDIGKPWTYYLFGLIPYVGFIILIVFYCKDSDGDNQWGPAPQ